MRKESLPVTGTAAKAADRYAIDVLGIPSLTLMENASAFVADYITREYPRARVLIACGVGNNGADGLCAGRMLKERGYDPVAVCCGDLWKATWEFLRQLSDCRRTGVEIVRMEDLSGSLPEADVIVDAVFGIGLKREVAGPFRDLIGLIREQRCPVVSVDVPSGINADTGEEMGIYVRADATITFGRNKTGLLAGTGKEAAGKVIVCDIGIPKEAYT